MIDTSTCRCGLCHLPAKKCVWFFTNPKSADNPSGLGVWACAVCVRAAVCAWAAAFNQSPDWFESERVQP